MRRVDAEPTLETVDNAILEDLIGRRDQLRDFVKDIDSIEGNYSIFLDGEWGCGKTFFIKEAERLLAVGNQNLQSPETSRFKDMLAAAADIGLSNSHLPIYFNAWEHDYLDSPFLPLVETLVTSFSELKGKEDNNRSLVRKSVEALKAVKVNFVIAEVDFDEVYKAFAGGKALDELYGKRALREKLKDLLDAAKKERANRIVLFVDELDRCRPEYAVKTLEALKFLFDQDYLTMVFSVNARALGLSISSWYGNGFDGSRYLMRFYDSAFQLSHHNAAAYLRSIGIDCSIPGDFIIRCAERKEITMRDLNRCAVGLKKIMGSPDYARCANEHVMLLCLDAIAVGAVFFTESRPKERDGVLQGRNGDAFCAWMMEDEAFTRFILELPGGWFDEEDDPTSYRYASVELTKADLDRAKNRLEVFYSLIFMEEDPGVPKRYGGVHANQVRRSTRRVLGLPV